MFRRIMGYLREPSKLYERLSIFIKMQFRYTDRDALYWKSLKGKYKGKRGFVIGNGPSLKISDLELLSGEITIASNKIYLAFEQTTWRPTFFTISDPLVWKKIKFDVKKYFEKVHISNYLDSNTDADIVYWRVLYRKGVNGFFSDTLEKGAYSGHTITFDNLQLAVHLGLNPIYLIGCDHYYEGEKISRTGKPIRQGTQNTHFIEGYRNEGELVMPACLDKMENAYREAKKYSDTTTTKIYNASRGGHLEIFERIDFDQIIKSTK